MIQIVLKSVIGTKKGVLLIMSFKSFNWRFTQLWYLLNVFKKCTHASQGQSNVNLLWRLLSSWFTGKWSRSICYCCWECCKDKRILKLWCGVTTGVSDLVVFILWRKFHLPELRLVQGFRFCSSWYSIVSSRVNRLLLIQDSLGFIDSTYKYCSH